MEHNEILQLVRDLYQLSKTNKEFLHARFLVGDDPLKPYKDTIKDSMYPDVMRDKPLRISRAKRAISEYSKAADDLKGEAELMVFFVECGNRFTIELGDIDANFYDSLTLMYDKAIDMILSLKDEDQHQFKRRLKLIMDSSSGIGWGYHDELCDLYYDAFGDDE
ncbi:MAG: hypothetical protein ISS66_19810 [Desulfobacteraceae bacterium]|nr:hypothetical protein [Desulfobacteraceae bacterium]